MPYPFLNATMFFEGTIQEGISKAVGQQKIVVCFVTNDGAESQTWENEFLTDESIAESIFTKAVALRLEAGSDEAGYLAQIFPLPQTPTVVLIKDGELKEYITSGTSKQEFLRRVQNSFSSSTTNTSGRQQAPQIASPSSSQPAPPVPAAEATAPSQAQRADQMQRMLADRAARLSAEKEEAERKAKEDRAKAKAKAKAEAEAGAKTDAAQAYQQAELVKKKKREADEERQRILRQIENDKIARRERAAERERARIDNVKIGDVAASLANAPETKLPSTTKIGDMTALQVRLFDGSTIRSRFKTKSSLKEVRKWVDESRHDGKAPYTFKQVLTPLPNRNIDATEESKDLAELTLAPSSTLVLIPVKSFASAYDDSASGNAFTRLIQLLLGFLYWLFSFIGFAAPGTQPGVATTASNSGTDAHSPTEAGSADRRRDQQLYNGNSLNFEPRPEDEDK